MASHATHRSPTDPALSHSGGTTTLAGLQGREIIGGRHGSSLKIWEYVLKGGHGSWTTRGETLLLVVEGTMRVRAEGVEYLLATGDAVSIASGVTTSVSEANAGPGRLITVVRPAAHGGQVVR